MFCIGNLGDGGEESIIEEIKREDAIYLIMKNEENVNWQNPTKVRSYIKENMELIGDVSFFEIYQNKVNDNIEQVGPIDEQTNPNGEQVQPIEGQENLQEEQLPAESEQ